MANSASLPFALHCNSFQSSPSHFQAQSCFSTASPLARRTSQISSSSLNNSAVPHLPCGLQCLSKSDAPIQSTSRVPDSRFYVGSGDGPHHMQREENELENDSPFPRNLNGRALSSDSFPSQNTVVPATSTAFPSQNAVVPATSAGLTGGSNRYLLDFLKGTTLRKGVALSSKTGWDRSRINRKNSGTISDSGEGHGSSNAVDDLRGSSGLLAKRSHLKGAKPKVANTAYEEMQNATEQEDKRRLKGISEKVPSERLWMDRYAEPAKSRTFSLSDGQQLRLQNKFPGFKGSKERKPIQLPSLSGVSGNQPFSKSLSFASVEGKTRISQVKERRLTRKQDTLAGVGSSSSSQELFSFPDKDSSSKEQAHARYTTENNRQGKRMPFTTSVSVGEKWNDSMISTFHAKVQSGEDSGKSRGEDFYVIDTHETTTDSSMTESKILSREFRDRGREASSSTVKGSLDVKGKDLGSGASTPVVRQDDKQILSAFSQDFALPENLSSMFSKPSNPLPHSSKSNQQLIPGTQRHMPNGTGQDVTFSTSAKRLFKSIGSRSSPSKSSIPGRFSKYSYESDRKISKGGETPSYFGAGAVLKRNSVQLLPQSSLPASTSLQTESADSASRSTLSGKDLSQPDGMGSFSSSHKSSPSTEKDDRTKITEHSPLKVHPLSDLPFEYQYSYSETPNVAPIGYREPQFSPFGPVTMGRPWTGRAPLKPSKKKLPEFDSFNPPPRGKKGVKYVQNPGPFSEGQIPREASSREEILGAPLSKEEVEELVKICSREKRQLNLGRDGLIHNMLDLIHSHWKRRRVCRIKCKGVPTVDMDNVCMHLEEKTWGKIIHRAGGVVYLFRGRNYNYKNRPRIPLMLWKPAAPIYPKLIQPAPAGLTKEEADELRRIGRKVVPICKLGKNGVYLNLVKDVQEAFKADELVRVNCQGLNPSDFKKIGAKLKDLVPCVLLSFEREHILMWKGRGANSVHVVDELLGRAVDDVNVRQWNMEELEVSMDSSSCDDSRAIILDTIEGSGPVPMGKLCSDDESTPSDLVISSENSLVVSSPLDCSTESSIARSTGSSDGISMGSQAFVSYKPISEGTVSSSEHIGACGEVSSDHKGGSKMFEEANMPLEANLHLNNDLLKWGVESEIELSSESKFELNDVVMPGMKSEEAALQTQDLEEVDVLWEQAIESGVAMALDETESDSDFIYEKASKFAQAAPDGPSYTRSLLKALSVEENKTEDSPSETNGERQQDTKSKKRVTQTVNTPMLEVPPMGGLPIDELARLLAP